MKKQPHNFDADSELYKRILITAVERAYSIQETIENALNGVIELEEFSDHWSNVLFVWNDQKSFYVYTIVDNKTTIPFFIGMAKYPIKFEHRGNNETRSHVAHLNRTSEGSAIKIVNYQLDEAEAEEKLEDRIRHHKFRGDHGVLFNKQDVPKQKMKISFRG